ncbi:MAG: TIGR03792 family protein [Leptolyngbyaceae bacterium]|nr:TIGR03792 family protein [Leptolyngbyaceae bacterium]
MTYLADSMVIEWLKVKVAPEDREQYIQKDAEIWTKALANFPGFLGKEVWINPVEPSEVIMVIRWQSQEQWKAIPADQLQQIEQQFDQQVGVPYQLTEEGGYQVRKFPA